MATTQDDLNKGDEDYSAGFAEDQPGPVDQSDDDAFGLSPEKVVADEHDAGSSEAEPAGQAAADAPPSDAAEGGDATSTSEDDAQASANDANADGNSGDTAAIVQDPAPATLDVEKEAQRLRSWEGRLKAMQAQLKKAGADTGEEQSEAVAEAIEKVADKAGSPADEEAVEKIAENVEDGTMTAEQAMAHLAEEFGQEFVAMIEIIAVAKAKEAASSTADEKIGRLSKSVDDIIEDIVDGKARAHFQKIADAYPDFNEIGNSDAFKQYVDGLPDAEKASATEVIDKGSADDIIKLLKGFKDQAPQPQAADAGAAGAGDQGAAATPQDDVDEGAMDDAEGVRSSGMRLPEQPAPSDDFEGAWKQF